MASPRMLWVSCVVSYSEHGVTCKTLQTTSYPTDRHRNRCMILCRQEVKSHLGCDPQQIEKKENASPDAGSLRPAQESMADTRVCSFAIHGLLCFHLAIACLTGHLCAPFCELHKYREQTLQRNTTSLLLNLCCSLPCPGTSEGLKFFQIKNCRVQRKTDKK